MSELTRCHERVMRAGIGGRPARARNGPANGWARGDRIEGSRSVVTTKCLFNSGEIHVGPTECGLWFRGDQFQEMLGPGVYRFPAVGGDPARDFVEIVDTQSGKFEHPRLDELLTDDLLRQSLLLVEVRPSEQAVVWKDQRPAWVIGPGRHAFWREPFALRVTRRQTAVPVSSVE